MKRFLKLIFCFFVLSFSINSYAQDVHFSQFYANPMYLNPAYAGSNFCPRWILNYRNQWPMLPGDYVSYNSSFDFGLNEIHGGIGLILLHDNAGSGVLTTNKISLLYSYHANISSTTTLSAGFQFSYFERELNPNLIFGDQIDELYGVIYPTFDPLSGEDYFKVSYTDLSAGLLLTTDRFFLGSAIHHLTEPSYSFLDSYDTGKLPMKITVHGGSRIVVEDLGWFNSTFLSKFSVLTPHFVFQKQADSEQINIGGSLSSDHLALGLSYRRGFNNSDALIILVGYELEKYKIGYSYDMTVSKLGLSSGGAHEISLQIQLGCFYKKPSQNTIPCPKF